MTPINSFNIYEDSTPPKHGERFDTLFQKNNIEIIRIVSSDKIDYDVMCQAEDEWVIMLEGSATIMIGEKREELLKGDYCFIPAKQDHKILSISEGSIWLAVHIR